MISNLQFTIDWLTAESGTDAERASYGALSVRAGENVLTEVIDTIARTTRPSIRVSLDRLANWFADNWWRLRWEPTPEPLSSSWRMAHEMGAAGGGFVWPRLRFSTDGATIRIQARPTREEHTIRYVGYHDIECTAGAFGEGVDDLLAQVLSRQMDCNAIDADLRDTWQAVLQERADAEATAFRKREAMMGLDPGEVDEDKLAALFREGAWIGERALDETLAGTGIKEASSLLANLETLQKGNLARVSFDKVLEAVQGWHPDASTPEPWRNGASLAKHLRKQWGLDVRPVTDEFLNDVLKIDIQSSQLAGSSEPPFGALREDDQLRPLLRRTIFPANRRFDIARLIADSAVAAASDVLYPLTHSHTARQKFQRAAAQEFLCPIEGLSKRISLPYPDEEQLAQAAKYYDVSELLVTTALVNRGLIDRDHLG